MFEIATQLLVVESSICFFFQRAHSELKLLGKSSYFGGLNIGSLVWIDMPGVFGFSVDAAFKVNLFAFGFF